MVARSTGTSSQGAGRVQGGRRIAYVSHLYPRLTETFVYREVLALRRQGLHVHTFGAWQPDEDDLSEEARPLVAETAYVFPLDFLGFVASHLGFFLGSPLRYLGTLWMVISCRDGSRGDRLLGILHFLMGVRLASLVKRSGADHVHAQFSAHGASLALVASRLLDLPFSFTAHNLLFTRHMLLGPKLERATFVAAISEDTRDYILDRARPLELAGRVHIVRCGIRPSEFPPRERRGQEPRQGQGDPSRSPTPELLFVAQLAPRKGVLVLIEACRLLRDRGNTFRCRIVGSGPDEPAARELVLRHQLGEVVELAGALPQESVRPLLEQADLFVLPCIQAASGDRDGIPVALMEAMAKEVPVVSTRISGIPELVEDRATGLLVEPGDPSALADAMAQLLVDHELRDRLAAAGRQRVLQSFDVDRNAELLAELLGATGEAGSPC